MGGIYNLEDRKREGALSWLKEGGAAMYRGVIVAIQSIVGEDAYFKRPGSNKTEHAPVEDFEKP